MKSPRRQKARAVPGQAHEKPSRAARKEAQRLRREQRTSALRQVRALVAHRSSGSCEFCGHRKVGELHHVLSGTGRRRGDERVETMAAICTPCHQGFHAGRFDVMEDALTWALWNGFELARDEIHRRLHKARRTTRRTA